MPAKLEEITATYLCESFRFDNPDGDTVIARAWCNGEVSKEIAIKGQADLDELQAEQAYRFYGRWTKYRNKRTGQDEEQFHFQSFVKQAPHNREGVIAYLRNAGEGLGFGNVRATKLWDLYGSEAVQALRERPAEVAARMSSAGLRMTVDQAEKIAELLREEQALEGCTLEVMEILAGQGFRKTLTRMVIKKFGNRAPLLIRKNPFCLLKFPDVGFTLCDNLWNHLGLPKGALRRQAYCAWNAAYSDRDGNTWIPRSTAEGAVRKAVGRAHLQIDKAIRLACRAKLLAECKTNGANGPISDSGSCSWLAVYENAETEQKLAELIAQAMDEPHQWPAVDEIENIDGEQPEKLSLALRGPIAILGGRPGSGKTFTAANLIRALIRVFGEGEIGIGAPTNLAAQRLNLAMAEYQVPAKATTNHRLLGRPRVRGQKWNHNETNPLPYKVLVFDEESMKNTAMMCDIFRARARGTMVLLIGDINQLPPIEHGAPLRDMIAAGLPYGELKEIRRNSGGIVEACAAIAEGRPWGAGDNLEIVDVDDEPGQQHFVLQKLQECKEAGFDPIWDSRVIVARNESRRLLNKLLQQALNPNPGVEGSPFITGDKVICRDNAEFKVIEAGLGDDEIEYNDSGDCVRVANGELGKVLEIHDSFFIIEVFCPRRVVKVPRQKVFAKKEGDEAGDGPGAGQEESKEDKTGTGCCWDLAYAVTYHSSQGSEFAWPILVASTRDGFMGSRELVYTGISRGKAKVKLIGRKVVWDRFCKRVALNKRKTLLRERIHLARAKNLLADL